MERSQVKDCLRNLGFFHYLAFSILTVKLYGYINRDLYLLSVHLIPQMVKALSKQKICPVPYTQSIFY